MIKKTQIDNDEINLFELIQVLWDGKWKLALAIVISVVSAIGYLEVIHNKNIFTAITKIQPVGTLEENKYTILNNSHSTPINGYLRYSANNNNNAYPDKNNKEIVDPITYGSKIEIGLSNFFKISKEQLLEVYINELNEKKIFENAIRKFNLLDASQYSNEQIYNEEITKLAASIKILSPVGVSKKAEKLGNVEVSYNTVNFIYDDAERWKAALLYSDKLANEAVRLNFTSQFNALLLVEKKRKDYKIEDLKTKIYNTINDFERVTSDRLSFLKEQAEIATELGIRKNTIEVQTFLDQKVVLSDVRLDSPLYLRGYEAINKEIEITKSRTNKKAFVTGLLSLEQELRTIEQDKDLDRKELLFASSPLANNKDFFAASMKVLSTEYKYENNNKVLVISTLVGLIIGFFYIYISNSLQIKKIPRKK